MYAIVVSGTNEHSKSLERVKVSASASTDEREFLPFKLLWTGDLDPQQEFEVGWFKVRSDHTAGTICYVTADGQNEFVKRVHIHMTISAKDVAERVSNYVLNTNRPEFSHLTLEADTDIP